MAITKRELNRRLETKNKLAQQIKSMLGYPSVKVSLSDEEIIGFIDNATQDLSTYFTETRVIELPVTPVIDVRNYSIREIVKIYDAYNVRPSNDIDIFRTRSITNYADNDYIVAMQKQSLLDHMIPQSHKLHDDKLYLTGYSGAVTVEYIPQPNYSLVKDDKWISYIRRLALAYAKESEGRRRSKFKIEGLPVQFDGDTLLNEGREEKKAILEECINKGEGFFKILR